MVGDGTVGRTRCTRVRKVACDYRSRAVRCVAGSNVVGTDRRVVDDGAVMYRLEYEVHERIPLTWYTHIEPDGTSKHPDAVAVDNDPRGDECPRGDHRGKQLLAEALNQARCEIPHVFVELRKDSGNRFVDGQCRVDHIIRVPLSGQTRNDESRVVHRFVIHCTTNRNSSVDFDLYNCPDSRIV